MKILMPRFALIRRFLAVLFLPFVGFAAAASPLDFGVDPAHLGTGEWVYVLNSCVNHLGGVADNVTNVPTMLQFFKKHGVDYIAVKAGTGAKVFPSAAAPQFTPELVKQAHAAGLRIFGYSRSDGKDVPGEIALAKSVNAMGADGFIIDAEAEWEESHLGTKGPALAIELCQGIREAYPTRFLAHAPMPIISKHASFPYKEFGRYCDATMPQAYWKSIGVSPKRMVDWMEAEWHSWNKSLTGDWTNAIKPLAPIAQAWSPTEDRVLRGAEIVVFANELKALKTPASPTAYKSISYWRCDMHTLGMWKAIRRVDMLKGSATDLEQDEKDDLVALEKIGPAKSQSATDLILDNNGPDVTLEGKWFPGKMKPSFFGSNYECVGTVAGEPTAKAIYRPKITQAGSYDIYVWYPLDLQKSGNVPYTIVHQGASERVLVDQTTNGGQWILIGTEKYFDAGTQGYVAVSNDLGEKKSIIVADAVRFRKSAVLDPDVKDSVEITSIEPPAVSTEPEPKTVVPEPEPTATPGITVASAQVIVGATDENVVFEGNWHEGKMGTGYYTQNYKWTSTANHAPTASATFQPDIKVAGAYDVYVWHTVSTNRSRNARWEIHTEDGSESIRVNQRHNGARWHLISTNKYFAAGKGSYLKLSNDTGEASHGETIIIADAVRLVLKAQTKAEAHPSNSEKHVVTLGSEPVEPFVESERDILLDNSNPAVAFAGKWTAQSGTGCFGASSMRAQIAAGTADASAVYRPRITVAGDYDVYIWYPPNANNSDSAQWLVSWNGGNAMISVDQTKNGGQWVQIASAKSFSAGTSGSVTLFNDTNDTGHDRIVVADAVRFRLHPGKQIISSSR